MLARPTSPRTTARTIPTRAQGECGRCICILGGGDGRRRGADELWCSVDGAADLRLFGAHRAGKRCAVPAVERTVLCGAGGCCCAPATRCRAFGQKVLPLFSSVIELVGKVIFVLVFIPKFQYNAVILCEPIIWFFMTAYLVAVYLHEPFVFPKNNPLSYRCDASSPERESFFAFYGSTKKAPFGELDANKVSRLKGVTAPNSQSCSPAHRCAGRPCTGGSRGCQSWRSPAGWRGQRWR